MSSPAIRALKIRNFRSLQHVDLTFGPLNVLVGPNGAGKTNVLDALAFLGDAARTDLLPALQERGGYGRVRFRGDNASGNVQLGLVAEVTQHASSTAPDEYDLSFRVDKRGRVTRTEDFTFKRTSGRGRRIQVTGSRVEITDRRGQAAEHRRETSVASSVLGLATIKRLGPSAGQEQVVQLTDVLESFRVFEVDVQAARRPAAVADPDAPVVLASDGSNVSAFLYRLAEDTPDLWVRFVEDARAILPGLADLHFRPVGGATGAVVLELEELGLSGRTDLAEASFGTVRGLALLALLHDPDPPRITCVEEIDHGLHPYAIDRIVDLLRDASERTQLLVATHSPVFVNRLRSDELIVCERDTETGASRIPAIDPDEVRAMADAGELQLGELWFSGALGGVPA